MCMWKLPVLEELKVDVHVEGHLSLLLQLLLLKVTLTHPLRTMVSNTSIIV